MQTHPQGRELIIKLLGHFKLQVGDTVASTKSWRKQKPRQLFALLVNAPYHRLSRSDVYAALWPDHPNPGNNLHVTIHHLRKMCDELPSPDIDILLSTEQVTLQLPEHTWIDVHHFEQGARRVLHHGGEPAEFRDIIDTYRGPFLPDDEADLWTVAIREHLAQLYAQVVLLYADMMARHDPQAAIAVLQQLIVLDPTHEGAVIRLMLIAHRQGQRSLVQTFYEQLQDALQTRLDLDPMPQTVAVAEACLQDKVISLPLSEWGLAHYRQRLRTHLPFAPVKDAPIGREQDFQHILDVIGEVPGGTGGIIGIAGSAGMGKLQLAQAVLTTLYDQDWIIIAGRPFSGDKARAYEPIIEALAEYLRWSPPLRLDDLAQAAMLQLLGPAVPEEWRPEHAPPRLESQSLLFLGLIRLLESISQHGPVALFIDDFHRADQDTIEFLLFLLRRIRTLRLLLLLTYRPEEVDPAMPELVYWQEGVRAGTINVFNLKPLQRDACLRLLQRLDCSLPEQLVDQLIERSGGNPFFLQELGRQASTMVVQDAKEHLPFPSTILDILHARLQRLSSAARAALELGAVAMPHWTIKLTEHVLKMPPSSAERAVEELLTTRVVREREHGLMIGQLLLREMVYRNLSRSRRMRLHGLIAEYLARHDALSPHIWQHLLEADVTAERATMMIQYGLQAATQALEIAADDEARRTFERVLGLMNQYGGAAEQWIRVLFGLATIAFRYGHYEQVQQYCKHVAEWTAAQPLAESERLNRLGWVSYRLSDTAEAREHFQAARALAVPHSLLWAEALTGEAVICFVQGELHVATTLLDQAIPCFDDHVPSVFQARGLFLGCALAFDAGNPEQAETLYERSVRHAERAGDVLYAALLRTNRANMLIRRGELREALRVVSESLSVSQELGNRDYESLQYTYFVWIHAYMGDLQQALTVYDQAILRMEEIQNTEIQADLITMKAMIYRYQNMWEAVPPLLHTVLHLLDDQPYHRSKTDTLVELTFLNLYGPSQNIELADQYARQALVEARKSQHKDSIAFALLARGSVLDAQGDYVRAAETTYEAVALLKRIEAHLLLIEAYLLLARIALHSGDPELARTEVERSKALALRCEAGTLYREIIDFAAQIEAQRAHSPESRAAHVYNEDWLLPVLTGEQSLAERARDLGISRAQLRRAYQRYQQHLNQLQQDADSA